MIDTRALFKRLNFIAISRFIEVEK